jgi:prepilin-type N-terminal cleavage/methylation domain-containing protein
MPMTLPIGSNHCSPSSSYRRGFTLVEVLVTLVILSLGLVAMIKGFQSSLERSQALTTRLYAGIELDNRVALLQRMLKVYKVLPFDMNVNRVIKIGRRTVDVDQKLSFSEVDNFIDLFDVEASLSWQEGQRTVTISRQTYLSEFSSAFDRPES